MTRMEAKQEKNSKWKHKNIWFLSTWESWIYLWKKLKNTLVGKRSLNSSLWILFSQAKEQHTSFSLVVIFQLVKPSKTKNCHFGQYSAQWGKMDPKSPIFKPPIKGHADHCILHYLQLTRHSFSYVKSWYKSNGGGYKHGNWLEMPVLPHFEIKTTDFSNMIPIASVFS